MKRIFGAILTAKLADFENEVRMLGETLVSFSIEVYNVVIAELLPIPSKSHYLFNMRDLAKVNTLSWTRATLLQFHVVFIARSVLHTGQELLLMHVIANLSLTRRLFAHQ